MDERINTIRRLVVQLACSIHASPTGSYVTFTINTKGGEIDMIRIVVCKKHGCRKTVEGSTLTALRDGINDLRFDDSHLVMHAIDDDGVSTFVMGIEVVPEKDDKGVEFRIQDIDGKIIG